MEKEIPNRVVDANKLEIGSTYVLQYNPGFFYIGELAYVTKRHSVHHITVEVKNKKGHIEKVEKTILGNPHYDVLVFKSERQKGAEKSACLSRMFENTIKPESQFYFTNAIVFESNLIKEEVHDWAISKMLNVHGARISNANLYVTIKIAISMMQKKGYLPHSINAIVDRIRNKSVDIIDIKQYEWEKLLEDQANDLPF